MYIGTVDYTAVYTGRIVAPPAPGSDSSPTYFDPQMFVMNAGSAGIASNLADRNAAIALQRNNESNTSSPNPQTAVGSAGTAGLPGQTASDRLITLAPRTAITGPGGTSVTPTIGRTPTWMRPALLIAAGFAVGWLVFK
jgi:hypothetical protein